MPTVIIRTAEELAALEAMPFSAAESATPFDGVGLALAYLADPPRGVKPFLIVVTAEDGRLLGFAPWCLVRDRLGLAQLTGLGGADAWLHDPYVARPELATHVSGAIADALVAARGGWDYMALNLDRARSAPLVAALRRLGRVHQNAIDWRQHKVLALGPTWESTWERFSSNFRRSYRRERRKLEALPHRFYEVEADQAPALLQAIYRFQASHWPDARDWKAFHAYMDLVCREALAAGRLLGYALEVDGRLVAGNVAIRVGPHGYGIFNAFDPAYAAYAPGKLLAFWSLETMTRAGIRRIDMGPGDQGYKERLKTELLPTVEVLLAGSVPGRAATLARGVLLPAMRRHDALRRLHRWLRAIKPGLGRRPALEARKEAAGLAPAPQIGGQGAQ